MNFYNCITDNTGIWSENSLLVCPFFLKFAGIFIDFCFIFLFTHNSHYQATSGLLIIK